jgi:hypothetical protein
MEFAPGKSALGSKWQTLGRFGESSIILSGEPIVRRVANSNQCQAILGETPNLAARLLGIAEPNSVVIAESTRKLVGNLFELEDLGSTGPQRHRRSCEGLGGVATLFSREPLRLLARAA